MFSRRLKCVSNSVCIHTEQKIRDNGKGTRKKRYAMYCSDLVIYLFPCTKSEESRHLIQTTRSVKASLSASPGDLEGQKIATRNRRMIDCVSLSEPVARLSGIVSWVAKPPPGHVAVFEVLFICLCMHSLGM